VREALALAGVRLVGALPPRTVARLSRRRGLAADGDVLDPELALLLAVRRAGGTEGVDRVGVAAARERARRQALLLAGPEVLVGAVRELAVDGAAGALPARHYAPVEPGGPHPLLVYLHGGGMVIGDLDTHDVACRRLCRHAGAHVLSVAYRLAPEHPFPAPVRDARAALAWGHAHAGALGADPARVAIGGDSAGATLAAVVARLAARDGGPAPVAQLLLYPPVDRARSTPSLERFAAGPYLTAAEIAWYHARYLDGTGARSDDPLVSPLLAPDLGGLARALVVTAAFDPLRDEGEAYAEALRAAGTPVLVRRMPGLVHGFVNLTGLSRASRDAVVETAGAFRALLARRPASTIASVARSPASPGEHPAPASAPHAGRACRVLRDALGC
jgi:acetyl esterase